MKSQPARALAWKPVVDFFASVRLTIVLIIFILPPIIISTLIPQGQSPQEYLEQYNFQTVQLMDLLGVTNIYRSLWFFVPMFLLGVNVTVCTVKSMIERSRYWGYVVTHIGILLLIVGGLVSAMGRIQGQIQLHEGETADSFEVAGKKVPLGFGIKLKKFEIETYGKKERLIVEKKDGPPQVVSFERGRWTEIPGTSYKFRSEEFVPDFRVDFDSHQIYSASNQPRNPALRIHIQGEGMDYRQWLLQNFPEEHPGAADHPLKLRYEWEPLEPKDFLSQVEILKDGKVLFEKLVEVNYPLNYKGFRIYQINYDPSNYAWSGFQVVKDVGASIVFWGSVCFMVGTIHSLYIWPNRKKNGAAKK